MPLAVCLKPRQSLLRPYLLQRGVFYLLLKTSNCWRDGLEVWDRKVVKLGCDDGCTTINRIKFTELKKEK